MFNYVLYGDSSIKMAQTIGKMYPTVMWLMPIDIVYEHNMNAFNNFMMEMTSDGLDHMGVYYIGCI